MGSPKQKDVGQKELKSPTIAEKIRLLEIGKETGRSQDIERLPDILEGTKEILLPLVPWLDKPLFSGNKYLGCFVPKRFRRKRGMRFFDLSFMTIWLERSGKWFLWLHTAAEGRFFREADSRQLAEIVLQKSDDFLKEFFRNDNFLKELAFLKEIALYYAIFMGALPYLFEAAMALVEEREKRLRIMKERLNLLDDFVQSLDPLVSQGKTVTIKEYSIWRDHERGTSRCTEGYLCPEALEPFWEVIKKWPEPTGCRQDVSEYRPRSLKDFFWRLSYFFEEIAGAKSRGHLDANSLSGFNSGRLPFTEKELMIIKEIVDSITT